jgi:hypothetical protein
VGAWSGPRGAIGSPGSQGQGISPPGNPTATTTSGLELKRLLDSGRQSGPALETALWEGVDRCEPLAPIPAPPPLAPSFPWGLTGSKAGSSKLAAGHLRKNSSGVAKGRPRLRANWGEDRGQAEARWPGGGQQEGRLTRRSAQEKSFFFRPGAQLAGRPAASGTEGTLLFAIRLRECVPAHPRGSQALTSHEDAVLQGDGHALVGLGETGSEQPLTPPTDSTGQAVQCLQAGFLAPAPTCSPGGR